MPHGLCLRENSKTYDDLKTQNNGSEERNVVQFKGDSKLKGFFFPLPGVPAGQRTFSCTAGLFLACFRLKGIEASAGTG